MKKKFQYFLWVLPIVSLIFGERIQVPKKITTPLDERTCIHDKEIDFISLIHYALIIDAPEEAILWKNLEEEKINSCKE